jgi:hypothetical protein
MCPNYDMWHSWFGAHQKYDPTSIVQSGEGVDEVIDNPGGDAVSEHQDVDYGDAVDADAGGNDAALSDDQVQEAAANATRDAILSTGNKVAGSVPPTSPPAVGVSPRAGTKRPASGALGAAATAKVQLQSVISSLPLVSSPSQSTSSSGKSSFDSVYAKAAESKVIALKEIAHTQATNALEVQKGEHHFQAQKLMLEMRVANEERKSRQKIEFEKNIATLLVADRSGQLAKDFISVLRDEQERQALPNAGDDALVAFANSLSRS